MNPLPSTLLVVTDRHQARQPIETLVARILEAGARWIWFRDRDLPPPERAALAARLADQVARFDAVLSIGGDSALAAEVGAKGVHLPSAAALAGARVVLGRGALIGVSAHRLEDVAAARESGADYVTLSPIYLTSSKPGYGPALGVAAIESAASNAIPVLALGGVNAQNFGACRAAGAAGAAVMGEIMRASDEGAVIRELLRV